MSIALKVLGVQEDNGWYAIAIDMNLRGFGKNSEEALDDLLETIEFQINYAIHHGTLDQIFIPADKYYLDLYEKIVIEEIKQRRMDSESKEHEKDYIVQDVFMPSINQNVSNESLHP